MTCRKMTRRGLLLGATGSLCAAARRAPNIILVMADDMGTGGYKNTGKVGEVVKGSSYTFEYSAGNSYLEHWRAWIDYNTDGDFFDAGEEVMVNTVSGSGINTANITGPATAPVGRTTMRVTLSNGSYPMLVPCGTFSYGEVEDYTLDIFDCSPAIPATVSNITENSATLSWTGNNNVASYELKYKPATGTNWTLLSGIASTSYTLTGLNVGQTYNWEIRALCNNNGSTASFRAGQSFATLERNTGRFQFLNLKAVRSQAEKQAVEQALALGQGNVSQAADLLGVSRPTLYDLMAKYGCREGSRESPAPPAPPGAASVS